MAPSASASPSIACQSAQPWVLAHIRVAVAQLCPGLPMIHYGAMKKLLLIVLCFILPPLAVFFHEGLTRKVLWALLWQLLGHVPGVIYGLLVVTKEPAK